MLSLEETDWRVLLKSIRQRNCILPAGPGVVVDPADPQGDPLPVQFAQRLAGELRDAGKGDQLLTDCDLAHVGRRTNARCANALRPLAAQVRSSPAFDLDNIYGRGPGDQPYLYDEDGKHFLLGDPLMMGNPGVRDLQRNGSGRALIGDPRNGLNFVR